MDGVLFLTLWSIYPDRYYTVFSINTSSWQNCDADGSDAIVQMRRLAPLLVSSPQFKNFDQNNWASASKNVSDFIVRITRKTILRCASWGVFSVGGALGNSHYSMTSVGFQGQASTPQAASCRPRMQPSRIIWNKWPKNILTATSTCFMSFICPLLPPSWWL